MFERLTGVRPCDSVSMFVTSVRPLHMIEHSIKAINQALRFVMLLRPKRLSEALPLVELFLLHG